MPELKTKTMVLRSGCNKLDREDMDMTDTIDYTFCLSPGSKTRYIVGLYDKDKHLPRYSIEISVPQHVRQSVESEQFLLEFGDGYHWAYDIRNNSTWPAYIIIKKDNVLVIDPCFQ